MEQLELKYLQYALVVARCGSVTQAARELYLAQPNLSRAVAELEASLGFPLFIRTRQGMHPTPPGRTVFDRSGKAAGPFIRPGPGVPSRGKPPVPSGLRPFLPVCQFHPGVRPPPARAYRPV